MTRAIMAREATVKTATVDVRALTISGRQVTLSVFRQLKDDEVLDQDTGDLRGVPWGVVNYFWGDCAKASEHLHVVWQKGDQLRRACVYPKPQSTSGHQEKQLTADRLFLAYLYAAVALDPSRSGITWDFGDYYRKPLYPASCWVHDRELRCSLSTDEREHVIALLSWEDRKPRRNQGRHLGSGHWVEFTDDDDFAQYVRDARKEHADPLRLAAKQFTGMTSPDEIMTTLIDAVQRLADFEQRWRDQYAALADLDHLFIAV